ncbi:MAG: putative Inosine-uridine nucleoside N-ribohydrolase [Promethearchaeota archaeon]|nr:MAG: putative Inosine-uridine nucleoside N-ribohydrolase [Candidatus Lokiarchaeota archaeon]
MVNLTEKVVIDTDNTMGKPFWWNDDGLAILYSFGEKRIDVMGITTVYGNSSVKNVYKYTKELLTVIEKEEIPLKRGAENNEDLNTEAAEFLADVANKNPGEISILSLGPLTNLYGAHLKDPSFFENLKQIIFMGGITEDRITLGRTKIKDVNLRRDLTAALKVIKAKTKVTAITCDICKSVPLKKTHLKQLTFWPSELVKKIDYEFWMHYKIHKLNHIFIWDVLVPVYLTNPEIFAKNIVQIKSSNVNDIKNGQLRKGSKEGNQIYMPHEIIDKKRFYEKIIATWRNLREIFEKKSKKYKILKDNKLKISIFKFFLSFIIPLSLRIMYKKQDEYFYEE